MSEASLDVAYVGNGPGSSPDSALYGFDRGLVGLR
jgi:hypothetical protein